MRKILNYLLGEDAVNEQNDREIIEALAGALMCAVLMILCFTAICIFG